MARLNIDLAGRVEAPTFILAKQSGKKLGVINSIDLSSLDVKISFTPPSELSFDIYKEVDGVPCPLWDEIIDRRLIWYKEINKWFQLSIDVNESSNIMKTITAKELGPSELGQVILYDVEINTDSDIAREDYVTPTTFYDSSSSESSLLHRVLHKAPHYEIGYVSPSLWNIQRQFSFDSKSLHDALSEIDEEIGCHHEYDIQPNGSTLTRCIHFYDLKHYCNDCGTRFDTNGSCPACGGTNIIKGYGKDTGVIVTAENLADTLTQTSNSDEVKNCFRLKAGDDLMTATIRNCLPSGDGYLWYLSDAMMDEMSDELRDRIEEYQTEYNEIRSEREYAVNSADYNALVSTYETEDKTFPHILSAGETGEVDDIITSGFSSVVAAYYSTIEFEHYLRTSMMPTYTMPDLEISDYIAELETNLSQGIAISGLSASTSQATIEAAVKSAAQMYVNTGIYNISVTTQSWNNPTWMGYVTLTDWGDIEISENSSVLTITITDDYESYLRQALDKKLSNGQTESYDLVGLFDMDDADFEEALRYYSLDCLSSFFDSCQTCIDVLIEQGCGAADSEMYPMYESWNNRLKMIQTEMDLRSAEVETVTGGLQAELLKIINDVHEALNFQTYVGEDLWKEFCIYRREDTYENSNYISTGLTDAELVENANMFLSVAEQEIYRAAHPQLSISTNMHNLLLMPEFAAIVDSFDVGNWIWVVVDGVPRKLRLLSYNINFGAFESLGVEFSEVETIRNTTTNIKAVLDRAVSMATTYSYVAKQAASGESANQQIKNWIDEGLAATNTKIISNADSQDWALDHHGLLMKQYDDITGEYSAVQLKLVNSSIAFTDDEWETVKAVFGRVIGPNGETLWGVVAQHIVGKLIAGETLVIESSKKDGGVSVFTVDENGAKLKNAVFEITSDGNQIVLNPSVGIAIGIDPLFNEDGTINEDNAKLWIDADGNLRMDGSMVVKEINAAEDALVLKGNRLIVEADNFSLTEDGKLVVDTDNFSLDDEGNCSVETIDTNVLNMKSVTLDNEVYLAFKGYFTNPTDPSLTEYNDMLFLGIRPPYLGGGVGAYISAPEGLGIYVDNGHIGKPFNITAGNIDISCDNGVYVNSWISSPALYTHGLSFNSYDELPGLSASSSNVLKVTTNDGVALGYLNAAGYQFNGVAVADFIVEQGKFITTDGNTWIYEKWNSGRAHMSISIPITDVAIDMVKGALYSSNDAVFSKSGNAYPFAFIEKPNITAGYVRESGVNTMVWWQGTSYLDRPHSCYLFGYESGTATGTIHIKVDGYYK